MMVNRLNDMPRKATTKRAATRRKPARSEPRIPAWVWLFTGAILGAFIMFLVHLSKQTNTRVNPASVAEKKPTPKPEPKPKFDFYELLKEQEVETPSSRPPPKKAAPTEYTEYMLQVASFKNNSDAERVRAELILLNLNASIETATVSNGKTWHRIIVGPFTNRSKLSKARSTLISNRYEALVLKKVKPITATP